MTDEVVTKDTVIGHLTNLRKTLAHSLTQPHISAKRFNEIRDQLLPLDQQLRDLGVDMAPTPQMAATYVKPTRFERRKHQRASKHSTYEQRLRQRLERDDD